MPFLKKGENFPSGPIEKRGGPWPRLRIQAKFQPRTRDRYLLGEGKGRGHSYHDPVGQTDGRKDGGASRRENQTTFRVMFPLVKEAVDSQWTGNVLASEVVKSRVELRLENLNGLEITG